MKENTQSQESLKKETILKNDNRKARRDFMRRIGYFKNKKTKLTRNGNIARGIELHEKFTEKIQENIYADLEIRLKRRVEFWKKMNYNKKQIERLKEAWGLLNIKNKSTRRADINKARKIMKSVC